MLTTSLPGMPPLLPLFFVLSSPLAVPCQLVTFLVLQKLFTSPTKPSTFLSLFSSPVSALVLLSSLLVGFYISIHNIFDGLRADDRPPVSEVIGRRPIYAVSMIFYFLFTLPSCLAKNIATMLAGRMIAGLASSAPFTNVGGTIADVWDTKDRGLPMAMFSSTLL